MKKNYFLSKNEIDKIIKICYPVSDFNIINTFIQMVTLSDLKNVLDILKNVSDSNTNLKINFQYSTLIINKTRVELIIDVLGNRASCVYYDDEFKNVLSDYIEEYEKMINEEVGLSK